MRRFFTMLAALAITIGTLATPPPTNAAVGFCSTAAHGYFQIYVDKHANKIGDGSSYMDKTEGVAEVATLNVCIGSDSGNGGTFVMAANIQSDATGRIFQVGYGKEATDSREYFYYANGTSAALRWPSSGFLPVVGHEYRFVIYPSGGNAAFKIEDVDTGASSTLYGSKPWGTDLNRSWWGYEAWDLTSTMGPYAGDGSARMRSLKYHGNASGIAITRDGWGAGYGDGNEVHKNFISQDPQNDRSAHTLTTTYPNDTLAVHTH